MAKQFRNGIDLLKTSLINAVLHPVSSDPSSPVDGQIWYRTDTDKFKVRANGVTQDIAYLSDVTGSGVSGTLWNAQSVVVAITDDNPVAQVIGESEVLGRAAGGDIGALTKAQLLTILNVEDGAEVNDSASEILAKLITVDGAASGLDADTVDGIQGSALATVTYVDAALANLIDSAPGALDTLNELAAALGDDANFSTTVTAALATKTTKYAATVGDGSTTAIGVTHNLGTTDVTVTLKDLGTNELFEADVVVTSSNVVTITFAAAPSLNSVRVVVVG